MKIAIVNDLPMAVEAISRTIRASSPHTIAWVAYDGGEAIRLCAQDRPDLILMDLMMPFVDGVEATRRIMAETPCAILLVTAGLESKSGKVFEALGAGALDVIGTPILAAGATEGVAAFLAKIEMLGRLIATPKPRTVLLQTWSEVMPSLPPLIAIGTSAGGPATVAEILTALPIDFPGAIVIVQHVDEQFAAGMANWLAGQCAIPVRLAVKGETPQAGTALLAATNDHLVLREDNTFTYTPDPTELAYRPSVDVFLESVAQHWKGEVVAVLLTGMGRDGARGLKKIRDMGALTIAQDRDTSIVYGMPKAAAELCAAVEILPRQEIAARILRYCAAKRQPQPSFRENKP